MEPSIPLDVLSNIKGAQASPAIQALFESLKDQTFKVETSDLAEAVDTCSVEDLRPDLVCESSTRERDLIKQNFPNSKNDYLVVPKVLD